MADYATVDDVAEGFRTLSKSEEELCEHLITEASILIDALAPNANNDDVKRVVVCRMVRRAIGSGDTGATPLGATQGSMTAGPYTQSWTMGNGSMGELYLGKMEKVMLGLSNKIGSYSPVEELVTGVGDDD